MDSKKLSDAKMNKKSFTVSKAQDLFQKLPMETQKLIKAKKQDVYSAIWGKDLLIKTSLLNNFLNEYEWIYENIKTFRDFENLDLEKQLFFKENFPTQYKKISNNNSHK